MKFRQNSKKFLTILSVGFLMATGTYNAVVINSQSSISGADVRFVKRLDEVYGVVESGREVAASLNWQKLSVKQAGILKTKKLADAVVPSLPKAIISESAAEEVPAQAAVQEDLNLNLTEVINPKKWQQGLNSSQFSGSLLTSNGVIESLNVSLPGGAGVSVSFSEMTGNVFEYDFEGELYSGMMYQVDQNSYMVTLTNGPLEGTRLKFLGEPSYEQQMQNEDSQRNLAESSDAEAGIYREEVAAEMPATNPEMQQPPMDEYQNQDTYAQQQGSHEQPLEQVQAYNIDPNQIYN